MAKAKECTRVTQAVAVSLVMAAFGGLQLQSVVADEGIKKGSAGREKRPTISIQAAATRGDAKAMYQLAMLHIEGAIEDADYDTGVRLLKRSASKGNRDAQRMYSFMDNAFSGEGC